MVQVGVDIGSFVFSQSAKTITFTGVSFSSISQIKVIIDGGSLNGSDTDIFNPGKSRTGALSAGGTVLTLDYNTNTVNYTDDASGTRLIVLVNIVSSSPALATEAKQDAQITNQGTDGATPPAIIGTGIRGWLRGIYEKVTSLLGKDFATEATLASIKAKTDLLTFTVDKLKTTGEDANISVGDQSNVVEVPIRPADTSSGFSTAQGKIDLQDIYNDVIALPVTDATHAAAFLNETLTPNVYRVAGAITVTGTITLDGQGDTNSIFIIRSGAAVAVAVSANIVLTNGARAENVYWIAETSTLTVGANANVIGNLIANVGAASLGVGCTLTGRVLSNSGAVSASASVLSVPSGTPYNIDFKTLLSFVMFTSLGAATNAGASTYTGDISTNGGALTGFGTATINGVLYPAGSTVTQTINSFVMLPARATRKKVIIKNNTDKTIYLNFDSTASILDIDIAPGDMWIEEVATTDINCWYEFNIIGLIKIYEIHS